MRDGHVGNKNIGAKKKKQQLKENNVDKELLQDVTEPEPRLDDHMWDEVMTKDQVGHTMRT